MKVSCDLPDNDGSDLNGVAYFVVDLEFLAVKVAGTQTKFSLDEKGIGPEEPVFPHRPGIAAEQ